MRPSAAQIEVATMKISQSAAVGMTKGEGVEGTREVLEQRGEMITFHFLL